MQNVAYRLSKWFPLIIVSSAIVAYVNSFGCPFIFDDRSVILLNSDMGRWIPSWWSRRVVAATTFLWNYKVGGFKPADYHAFNLLVHILAALCLYGIVRRTLLLPRFKNSYNETSAAWLAGFAALIWTVHPLQTESVTYICQRYESMAGLFFLMTFYCFIRSRAGRRALPWTAAGLLSCALGMATKESMFTAPILLLLYDYVFLSAGVKELLTRWKQFALYFSTWCIPLLLSIQSIDAVTAVVAAEKVSPLVYLMTQATVLPHYLRLAFFPYPLCLDYAWPAQEAYGPILVPFVVIAALGVASAVAVIRRSSVGFLGVWFFLVLAPSSSVIALEDMAFEHRMYLPLIAPVVLAVVLLYMAVAGSKRLREATWVAPSLCWLGGVVAIVLLMMTVSRNEVYRSEESVWRDVVSKRPDNLRARNDLAVALCEKGATVEAKEHFQYVLKKTENAKSFAALAAARPKEMFQLAGNSLEANRFRAYANMGLLAFNEGRYEDAAACYADALRIYPYSSDVEAKLVAVLKAMGVTEDGIAAEMARRVVGP